MALLTLTAILNNILPLSLSLATTLTPSLSPFHVIHHQKPQCIPHYLSLSSIHFSSHLISSPLISSPLISSPLISTLLISSLLSSHLSSSPLISSTLFSSQLMTQCPFFVTRRHIAIVSVKQVESQQSFNICCCGLRSNDK